MSQELQTAAAVDPAMTQPMHYKLTSRVSKVEYMNHTYPVGVPACRKRILEKKMTSEEM